jgi:hypothetical protein
MIRRLIAILLLIIGLAGVGLSIAGVVISARVVDAIWGTLDQTLTLTSRSLGTVEETLGLAKTTIADVNVGLNGVEETADSLAKTLADTQPLLAEIATLTSEDVPGSIENVQAAIPNMALVAGAVDSALVTLNDFRIDETILNQRISYDLGINYQRGIPFDETVITLGSSLDGLPERMRALEPTILTANENLAAVSVNIYTVSDDLGVINGRVAEVSPLLDSYITVVQDINNAIFTLQDGLRQQQENAKTALIVIMVWLGLMQFGMLYMGWDLLTDPDFQH